MIAQSFVKIVKKREAVRVSTIGIGQCASSFGQSTSKQNVMKKRCFLLALNFGCLCTATMVHAQAPIPNPIPNPTVEPIHTMDWQMTLLVFAPLLVFLSVTLIVFAKLGKEGFKLGDALKENEVLNISVDNPAMEPPKVPLPATDGRPPVLPLVPVIPPNLPPFVPKTVQPKSTSRLLAFITGLVSAGLASGICSFWIYAYIDDPKNTIDFTNLAAVLLGLGIGVIPYAVNRITKSSS